MRRPIAYGLAGLLVLLQIPLWFGSGGLIAMWQLKHEIGQQQVENRKLRERNRALEAEVVDLKQGYEAIEARARHELGMIRRNETYYRIVTPPAPGSRH
ncbi:MAG: cell division protein FtsB [Pseudomonadota bacterium]